jgi:hypothetical protein
VPENQTIPQKKWMSDYQAIKQKGAGARKQANTQNEVVAKKSGYTTKGRWCQKIRASRRMKWMSDYQAV